jgi:NTE family protein
MSAIAPRSPSGRPRIGLALGSGGARGWAHIGVLRALVRAGLEPDIIAGTSVGALVGGVYASGHLDTLDSWARQLSAARLFTYLDPRMSGGGLIGGRRMATFMRRYFADNRIEDLPIPFVAVATDLMSGHELWLREGRLVDVLRIAISLPGIFTPVRHEGHWLVDGALVNPVPVSAARVFGARLVIAVNLSSDVLGRGMIMAGETDEPASPQDQPERRGLRALFGAERSLKRQFAGGIRRPSIPAVMVESFNIMQDRITRARLAGDPPDVTINPRVGQVGWFDFHRAQEAIEVGARATERVLEEIGEAVVALAPRPAAVPPAVT